MPKKSEVVVSDPAASEIQRLTGLRLAAVRKLTGMTQEQVAEALGVDQSQWSRWERGCRIPDVLVMIRFVQRAKASLDLIYRGVPTGAHPVLQRLLVASAPDLLVADPTSTDQDTDKALASYRSSILQEEKV